MKIKLEPLNHSHISEVMEIENNAHLAPWSERIVKDSFGPRSHNVGLFRVEKGQYELIGYYFAGYVADEVSLENICIAIDHQRKNLSRILMQDLFGFALSISAKEIWLEVRQSNVPAISLYQGLGFEILSVRKNYYTIPNSTSKEHALSMRKEISLL